MNTMQLNEVWVTLSFNFLILVKCLIKQYGRSQRRKHIEHWWIENIITKPCQTTWRRPPSGVLKNHFHQPFLLVYGVILIDDEL